MAAADSDSALDAAINQTGSMLLPGSDDFERPVVILTGLGHPAAIASAMEAYMFLADWPAGRRDEVHGFALEASLAAIRGEI